MNDDFFEKMFENTIIEAIEDEYRATRKEMSDYISVTEVTGCLRRSYFNRKYPHEIPSWSTSAVIGKYIHQIVERKFAEKFKDYIVEIEKTFTDDILIGTVDIAIRDPVSKKSFVIDLKTTSKIPIEPYYNHVLQVNAYLYLANADVGYIIYIDKRFTRNPLNNNQFIKSFRLRFYNPRIETMLNKDAHLYQHVKYRAHTLKRCLEYDELPQKELSEQCAYCEHLKRCIE